MDPTPTSGLHKLTRTVRRRHAPENNSGWHEALSQVAESEATTSGLHSVVAVGELRMDARIRARFGETVGEDRRYLVADPVGEGELATVYEVYDRSTERPVAVKILRPDFIDDRIAIEEFLHEARVLAGLEHPAIPPVYDIGFDDSGAAYVTMKLLPGRHLDQVVEDATQGEASAVALVSDVDAVVRLFIKIGDALAAAHEQGVVHQDVKPEHVVLGEHGAAWLTGWGIARAAYTAGGGRPPVLGTPAFMSPEQARREDVSTRSDVYGLAASLFTVLTGRFPTWSDDEKVFWYKKREGIIDEPRGDEAARVPKELLAIIRRGLSVDPASRYADGAEIVDALKAFQSERGARLARAASVSRRRRYATVLSVLVVALVTVAGFVGRHIYRLQTQWTTIYEQNFDDVAVEDLRQDWIMYRRLGGNPNDTWKQLRWTRHTPWAINEGRLVGTSTDPIEFCTLGFARPVAGSVRVEWDITPLRSNQNLNSFIAADRRDRGYTFHLGGWGDPGYMALTKGPSFEVLQNRFDVASFEVGETYHMRMEREGAQVRLWVDDRLMFDYTDLEILTGPANRSFGFEVATQNSLAIDNIKVASKRLPERVTPIQLADALYDNGAFAGALAHYQALYRSVQATDPLHAQCLYKIGLSEIGVGDLGAGWRTLQRFEQEYAGHALVPRSLFERSRIAPQVGAEDQERLLLERLADRYPGHPVLRNVLSVKSLRYTRQLESAKATSLTDNGFPRPIADMADDLIVQVDDVVTWAERCRLSSFQNSFLRRSAEFFENFKRGHQILEHLPQDGQAASMLMRTGGHYERVLGYTRTPPGHRAEVLLDQARFEEALAEAERGNAVGVAWRASLVLDREAGAVRMMEHMPAERIRLLQTLGQYERIIAEHRDDTDAYFAALIAVGRAEQVLDDPRAADGGRLVTRALLALGRLDGLIERDFSDKKLAYLVALEHWRGGDVDAARALIDPMAEQEFRDWGDGLFFAHHVLPAVFAGLTGDKLAMEARLQVQLDSFPDAYAQRLRFAAGLLLGRIDEAAFLAQPMQRVAEADLGLLKAIQADVAGDAAVALAGYQAWQAAPVLRRSDAEVTRAWIQLRIDLLTP
ncbi:MAG: protein kinase [Planctomycetota bacterium]|jgi:tRNA A-37 threonylcarbamoyl transferase component Bud32|nr:protein kinase [Planctomycetota bacterium]